MDSLVFKAERTHQQKLADWIFWVSDEWVANNYLIRCNMAANYIHTQKNLWLWNLNMRNSPVYRTNPYVTSNTFNGRKPAMYRNFTSSLNQFAFSNNWNDLRFVNDLATQRSFPSSSSSVVGFLVAYLYTFPASNSFSLRPLALSLPFSLYSFLFLSLSNDLYTSGICSSAMGYVLRINTLILMNFFSRTFT